MDFLAHARRRAFSLWLRTGRMPRWARGAATEHKYNPWHDPDDGRFTFAGTGRYFGPRSARGSSTRTLDARMGNRPTEPFGGFGDGDGKNDDAWNGGGASGSWTTHEEDARTREAARSATHASPSRSQTTAGAPRHRTQRATNSAGRLRSIEANGHTWTVDGTDLPRQIRGTIDFHETTPRSRTVQRHAGIPDRRATDDGGHYIPPRFGGIPAPFNHFAQDANFNRGRWRALEDEWARDRRANKRIEYKIVPIYEGSSRRPSYIDVIWWVDGKEKSLKFPNESLRKPR